MNESPQLPTGLTKAFAACAKWSLWLLVTFWLVLALAWGALHGFIVPRIGELRPRLEAEAGRVLGVPVRIGVVSAQSTGLMPTLELASVVLLDPQGREALRLPRVVAVLTPQSLWNLGFAQLVIERPEVDVRRAADGRFFVAGLDFSRQDGGDSRAADWFFRQAEVVVRGGTLRWTDELRSAPALALQSVDLVVRNTARRHAIRLDATPPPEWGERFSLRGQFRQPLLSTHAGRWREWEGQIFADFPRVDLSHLRRHAQIGIDIAGGHGAVRAWADIAGGELAGGTADLSVAGVSTTLAPNLQPLALASLSGRVRAKRLDGGVELQTQGLQFDTADGQRWPGGNVFLSWVTAQGRRAAGGELRADRLELAALSQLAGRLPLGAVVHNALATHAPQGLVETVQARWSGPLEAPQKYELRGRVRGLDIAAGHSPSRVPGVRGANIDFDLTEAGGKAKLALQSGSVELPGVFEDPVLPVDRLAADLQWKRDGDRLAVTASGLKFSNPDVQGEGQGSWRTGEAAAARWPGVLDLQATLSRADGKRVWRYLPQAVPKATRDYVRGAIIEGEATGARIRVRGNLRDFPFRNARDGEFRVSTMVRDASYAFVPKPTQRTPLPWPTLTGVSGELVFERGGMRVNDARGGFAGAPGLRVQASADIPDLHDSVIAVKGEVRGPLAETLGLVQRTAISPLVGDVLAKATGNGTADVRLALSLPLAQIDQSKVQGSVTLAGNDVQFTPDTPALGRVRGTVAFTEKGFTINGAQARALGGDLRLEGGMRPAAPGEANIVLRAQGVASADGLRQAAELGALSRLAKHATGSAPYALTLSFRRGQPEVLVTSSLQGLALTLPAPLGKTAEQALPLRYENLLLRDPPAGVAVADQLSLDLGRLASIRYLRSLDGAQPRVLRGVIAVGLGPGEAAALPDTGVLANVQLATANVDAWDQVLDGLSGGSAPVPTATTDGARAPASTTATSGYLPTSIAVRARALTMEGRTLHNVVVGGSRDGLMWRANVDAEELNGYLEYRQSTSGTGPGRVYARLARLSIAASAARDVETLLDEQPGNIPALDIVVDDFELRGLKLGRLEIDAVNRGPGVVAREGGIREWRLNKLSLATPDANFQATGNWAAANAQPVPAGGRPPAAVPGERRRTVMNFRFDIADAGQTLARFGMKDVVRRGRGRMEGQVAWAGSPLTMDYPSLNGTFHVNVESGQFLKADPGLAKLLGVLSLQSLPRRLTLDFRDVFSQGFAFDFLRGDITIQQGIAATNNLQMKGVNAAVLMEGKADIARETQDIRVVVVPEINAGTASLVATVINPAIGLGTFLAQMFLREPLTRAATQQFQIDGTWTDPRITKLARPSAEPSAVGNN
jgi:uncharacterized protein (TIGR02099 family)